MKTWRVYRGVYGKLEVVTEGFNFWACFFPGLWGFAKGLPAVGIVGFLGALSLNHMPEDQYMVAIPLSLAFMLYFGAKGNSLVISTLLHDGYQLMGTLQAKNRKSALLEAEKLYKLPEPATDNAETPPLNINSQ